MWEGVGNIFGTMFKINSKPLEASRLTYWGGLGRRSLTQKISKQLQFAKAGTVNSQYGQACS